MVLPKSILFKAWQLVTTDFIIKSKNPHEEHNIFMANLWAMSLFQSLENEGYEICISKNEKKIWPLKP